MSTKSDQEWGHWVVFVGVSEEAYGRYNNNPSGFTAKVEDFLIRDVYDGKLHGNGRTHYAEETYWWLYVVNRGRGVFYP